MSMFTTKLHNLYMCDDPEDWGLDDEEFEEVRRAAKGHGQDVEVLCVAVDNRDGNHEHNNYDIKLKNGMTIDAVSGFHLKNINELMEAHNKI